VTFGEDLSRLRTGHGAKNMAIVRHFALNLVRQVADKRSIKRRRKRASRVVRQQVAGRGDVCGSSRPPWLGVETQRQWSDKAILRTTPVLQAQNYRMVSKSGLDLQRRDRSGPPRVLRPGFETPG
jgi:hypothetical protein